MPKTKGESVPPLECSNYLKCLPSIEAKYSFLQLPFGSQYSGLKNQSEAFHAFADNSHVPLPTFHGAGCLNSL